MTLSVSSMRGSLENDNASLASHTNVIDHLHPNDGREKVSSEEPAPPYLFPNPEVIKKRLFKCILGCECFCALITLMPPRKRLMRIYDFGVLNGGIIPVLRSVYITGAL
ncbi:hypothetical protein TNIN_282591 [Trichonephila inaurata madagascariensis]|uniref:Uncharacterized protein n=1 Tax=Trichonephila inaurata madagascariensis TaxID=2747483 RepID=A0A8X6WY97_9ARAC|nr:hypothetical protein TNIN_282591 [Trichonephila inaurata madagascariensis]